MVHGKTTYSAPNVGVVWLPLNSEETPQNPYEETYGGRYYCPSQETSTHINPNWEDHLYPWNFYGSCQDEPAHAKAYMQDLIDNRVHVYAPHSRLIHKQFGECEYIADMHILSHLSLVDNQGINPGPQIGGGATALYERLKKPMYKTIERPPDPTTDGEFSIWFLIRDLYELPKLARSIVRLNKELRRFRNELGQNVSGRAAAGSYLAYKFGLVPTLHDIRDFLNTMLQWHGPTKPLSPLTTVQTVYQEREIAPAETLGVSTYRYDAFGFPLNVKGHWSVSSTTLRQTVKYYYLAPDLQMLFNRVCQLIDKLGVFDPAAVWDIVPFTFVLDWFWDVSTWIRKNFKPHLYPVHLVLVDSCEALHRTYNCSFSISYSGSGIYMSEGYRDYTDEHIGSMTVKQVARSSRAPSHLQVVSPTLKEGKGLKMGRAVIGAALIEQLRPQSGKVAGSWSRRKRNLLVAELLKNGIPRRH